MTDSICLLIRHAVPKSYLNRITAPPTRTRLVMLTIRNFNAPDHHSPSLHSSSLPLEIEACPVCGDHFAQSDIAAHQQIHPQCGYCGQRFASLKSIKDHIVSVHGSVNVAEDQNYCVIEV